MDEQQKLVDLLKYGLCGRSHKGGKNLAQEPHECPFSAEMNNIYTLCNCCRDCEYECAMDIKNLVY